MAAHLPEPQWIAQLRLFLPPVLAATSAVLVDRLCAARGFLPPGFARAWRRCLGLLALAAFFWIALYGNLASLGREAPPLDLSHLTAPRLFFVHFLMIGTILVWFLAGFAGSAGVAGVAAAVPVSVPVLPPDPYELVEHPESAEALERTEAFPAPLPAAPPPRPPLGRVLAAQLGFLAPDVPHEIGVGVLVGVGSWFAVLLAAVVLALLLYLFGAEGAAPQKPPELVVWIAGLPLGVRVLAALSAGVVEETFFRGFLQPRIGLWLATAFFVLGHLAYGQPLLLVGIALLSLIYGQLVRWRQNIWPAIAAHALFDGVQLLVVIPTTLKLLGKAAGG
ncbi:MAG TPA: CPBP family intramembrane glutamic endopeptidase [Thermoanaerobaculia bacterium]|nr:CPBP family intramembrane glutamic endopeptidase [Thermoanaerobaculia bacterium]